MVRDVPVVTYLPVNRTLISVVFEFKSTLTVYIFDQISVRQTEIMAPEISGLNLMHRHGNRIKRSRFFVLKNSTSFSARLNRSPKNSFHKTAIKNSDDVFFR